MLWFSWNLWEFGLMHFINTEKFYSNIKSVKGSWLYLQVTQITRYFQPLVMTFQRQSNLSIHAIQWHPLEASPSGSWTPLPSWLAQILEMEIFAAFNIISPLAHNQSWAQGGTVELARWGPSSEVLDRSGFQKLEAGSWCLQGKRKSQVGEGGSLLHEAHGSIGPGWKGWDLCAAKAGTHWPTFVELSVCSAFWWR